MVLAGGTERLLFFSVFHCCFRRSVFAEIIACAEFLNFVLPMKGEVEI